MKRLPHEEIAVGIMADGCLHFAAHEHLGSLYHTRVTFADLQEAVLTKVDQLALGSAENGH